MAEKKTEHIGHRQRMKKKYFDYGIEVFSSHEVLEILLYYAVPRKDTNLTAHRLIEEYGSISAVLDAPSDLLVSFGIGEDAAFFLNFLPKFLEVYMEDKLLNDSRIVDKELISQKLMDIYSKEAAETVYLILMNSNSDELYSDAVNCGLKFGIELDIAKICELAVRHSARYVIISHNRPSGAGVPTQADIMTTIELYQALKRINIILEDNFLVLENRCISYSDSGIFFKNKQDFMNSVFYSFLNT